MENKLVGKTIKSARIVFPDIRYDDRNEDDLWANLSANLWDTLRENLWANLRDNLGDTLGDTM